MIEIAVGKSRYQLPFRDEEHERVAELAEKLNNRVNQLSLSLKNADEKTLLMMAALMLQEEIESAAPSESSNEDEIYEAVANNMDNISNYIEKLINKIQSY